MTRRLRNYRRRWCAWRHHPQASWSPVVMSMKDPDILLPDGTYRDGTLYEIKQYRCAQHDERPS